MRRSIVGVLAGCLVSTSWVSGQVPMQNGNPDGQSAPPAASAGSSFSGYGRYSQSAHFDGASYPDQGRSGPNRMQNVGMPANVQNPMNSNAMPNGTAYPMMNNGQQYGNSYTGPVPAVYPGPVQGAYPGPMMHSGPVMQMGNNVPVLNGPMGPNGNGVQIGNMNNGPMMNGPMTNGTMMNGPMINGNGVQIGNGNNGPAPGPASAPMPNNYGGMVFSNGPMGMPMNGCANGNCNLPCDVGCGCPTPCGPPGRFWFSAEYLLWWSSGMGFPPLVTGAPPGTALNTPDPAGGAPIPIAGALGQPSTTVLFGNSANGSVRSGLRLRAGGWLDDNNMLGIEGSFFFLGNQSQTYQSQALANNIVMRPFFNTSTGRQDAEIVNFPGLVSGTVTVDTRNDVYGADANLRRNLCCSCDYRVDLIGGYRFLSVNDRLSITENLTSTNPNGTVPAGTSLIVNDRFETDNQFHGAQIGLAGEYRMGRLYIDMRGLVAMGPSIKTVRINGTTTVTTPGGVPTTSVGGLLAQPTNIGTYTSTDFSVLPEFGLNVGYQVTNHLRLFAGYSFLYWNSVARAGNQIDFAVNSTQIPPGVLVGPANPAFHFVRSDYWLQGMSIGAQLRF